MFLLVFKYTIFYINITINVINIYFIYFYDTSINIMTRNDTLYVALKSNDRKGYATLPLKIFY